MRRRTILKGAAAIVAGLAMAGCGSVFSRTLPTYRYRLTVEVDTPEGLKTGSSVIEVSGSMGTKYALPDARNINASIRGEAVAVDIRNGQTLFVLLRTDERVDAATGFAEDAFPASVKRTGEDAVVENLKELKTRRGVGVLPANVRPMMVRFGNLADPKSVEKVDPENLAASFGKGVSLRRIIVEITDDPVTTGIEKRLGWLSKQRGQLITAEISDPLSKRILSSVSDGDFSIGVQELR